MPVSRTTRPVTQTAEVEVNSASNQGTRRPVAEATGSVSNTLPNNISPRKPRAIMGSALKPERRYSTLTRAVVYRRRF